MSDFGLGRRALAAALLLAAGAAQAQYAWIDDKGMRQYSDRPPPPTVPLNKILKSPRPLTNLAGEQPATAPAPAPAAAPKPTLADREADYRKRQKDQQDAQQKQQQESAQKKQVCDSALRQKAQLENGARLKEYDARGEASYVSDEDRAKRLAQANEAIAANGCR